MKFRTSVTRVASLLALASASLLGCSSATSEDNGEASHFVCEEDADCEDGEVCREAEGAGELRCVSAEAAGGAGGAGAGGTGGIDTGGGAGGTGPGPSSGGPALPTPSGACPTFENGTLATFTVDGEAREAFVWIDRASATANRGPLVLYWRGTGGGDNEAVTALGAAGIDRVTAASGVVVAPVQRSGDTLGWGLNEDANVRFADEIVACAEESVGIDARRIHSFGFGGGALHNGYMSFTRPEYLASVVNWSGGPSAGDVPTATDNNFAAMVIHGGLTDVFMVDLRQLSEDYAAALDAAGHFTFICDHGQGLSLFPELGDSIVQFFFDHPYGTDPSPYAGGLPPGFPEYCAL